MHRLCLTVGLALVAGAAHAQSEARVFKCAFDTECVGTEGCGSSEYELRFTHFPPTPFATQGMVERQRIEVEDVNDTVQAMPTGSLDGTVRGFVSVRANGDQTMLTLAEDGTARYSVHFPGSDIAIYYKGRCEPAVAGQ